MRLQPILIICFNRPDLVRGQIENLKRVQPEQLYFAVDGPRNNRPDDIEKCAEVRDLILTEISWECEVRTRFSPLNQGCRDGPLNAVSWFFEQEEAGIILEDDCVASPSFLNMASELLEKFSGDDRFAQICGSNELGSVEGNGSYFKSRFGGIWGWATWRSRWHRFLRWDSIRRGPVEHINALYSIRSFKKYRKLNREILRSALKQNDAWDYLWAGFRLSNGLHSLVPQKNLVQNVGFRDDATHTYFDSDKIHSRAAHELERIDHPGKLLFNEAYEQHIRNRL
jgi:hypothetical protein